MSKLSLKKVLQSTYKSKEMSENELKEHGYNYDRELSNINDRVYFNPNDDKLLISYRGTKNLINDIPTDLAILTGNLKNTSRHKQGQATYEKAKQKYNKDSVTLVGHSLGGSLASSIGGKNDNIITYNKGVGLIKSHDEKANEKAFRHVLDPVSALGSLKSNQTTIGNLNDNILHSHNTSMLDKVEPIFV